MKKEIIDSSTVWSNIFTDSAGWTWNILQREDGSVSLYTTQTGCHAVIYDTLDLTPLSKTAKSVIEEMAKMVEGMNVLLEAARKGAE